jgi:hypothetical protein
MEARPGGSNASDIDGEMEEQKAAQAQRLADEFEADFNAGEFEADRPRAPGLEPYKEATLQAPSFKALEAMDRVRARGDPNRTELGAAALDNNIRSRRSMASGLMKMPWEKWPYTMFMGSASKLQMPSEAMMRMATDFKPPLLPSLPISEDYARLQIEEMKRAENHIGLYRGAVQRTKGMTFKQMQDSTMRNLLSKSMILLEDNLYASKVGLQMVALFSELGYDDARATNMLLDVYGGKAPRTINKRIGALQRYVIWARKRSPGRSAFPMEEPVAYDYLCYLRKEGSSTAPSSFMGAVNFGFYVLGIEGCDMVSASARAKGVAHMQAAAKKPTAQRHPLTIQQARVLEEMVTRAPTVQDRNLAGFCTFLYLSRARFSDAMHGKMILDDMKLDPLTGYVEVHGGQVKTGTSAQKKALMLPMVAPSRGLGPDSWGRAWLDNRAAAKLGSDDLEFIQPGPSLEGEWLPRPWLAEEATRWMKDVFSLYLCPVLSTQVFGTHSLKATVLSWAAKFGVPVRVRRTLGYHIASDDTSCFTYGRDNQSEPLRWVERVLEAIRSGQFVPDQTRSGRFKEGSNPLEKGKEMFITRATAKPEKISALVPVLPVVVEVDKKSQDSASSSSSDDSATSEEPVNLQQNEELALSVGKPITYDYTRFTSHRLYQHTESGTLHWASNANLSKLECGRLLSNRFAKISQALRVNWSFCTQCAKKVQADEIVAASS